MHGNLKGLINHSKERKIQKRKEVIKSRLLLKTRFTTLKIGFLTPACEKEIARRDGGLCQQQTRPKYFSAHQTSLFHTLLFLCEKAHHILFHREDLEILEFTKQSEKQEAVVMGQCAAKKPSFKGPSHLPLQYFFAFEESLLI